MSEKMLELENAVKKAVYTFTEEVVSSWGVSGVSGNADEILASVIEIENTVNAILELESDISRTHGPDASLPVREAMIGMSEEVLQTIFSSIPELRRVITLAKAHKAEDGPVTLALELKFTFERGKQFSAAIADMKSAMTAGSWE